MLMITFSPMSVRPSNVAEPMCVTMRTPRDRPLTAASGPIAAVSRRAVIRSLLE